MKVRLLRDARIKHYAGEVIEVSPEECHFLVSTDGAVKVEAVETIEAPEDRLPEVEVPEKKARATKTAAKKAAAKKK